MARRRALHPDAEVALSGHVEPVLMNGLQLRPASDFHLPPLSPVSACDEIMDRLEKRVGPEGRKLFERFLRQVNKLQVQQQRCFVRLR
jgi:hypothetical protein